MDAIKWKELLEKAATGDTPAEEQLFTALYRPVWRYLMRRTADVNLANDLTQDVLLKWHQALGRIEFHDSPLPYVFTAARNALIDHRRKKKTISLESLDVDMPDPQNEQVRAVDKETRSEIEQALLRLHPLEQLIIELSVYESHSAKEIAHILKKSEASVRQIKHRALEKIRNLINPQ